MLCDNMSLYFVPSQYICQPGLVKPGHLHVESTKHLMQCTLPSVIADNKLLTCPHILQCWCVCGVGNMYEINGKSASPPTKYAFNLFFMPLYFQTTVYLPLLTQGPTQIVKLSSTGLAFQLPPLTHGPVCNMYLSARFGISNL